MKHNVAKYEKQSITDRLIELIREMSAEEKISLLQQIESYIADRSTEKRGSERIKCVLPINYLKLLEMVIDYANDISPSGLFMKTGSDFALGEEIYLRINFSKNSNPFQIPAKVIRTTDKGVGLKFKFRSQVQETIIATLINSLKKMK
jgi:Tfp pilus assembly protein PilZ